MVESLKGTRYSKVQINEKYDLLLNALTTVSRLRNKYIEIYTPHFAIRSKYDYMLEKHVNQFNVMISDINTMNSDNLQLVLLQVLIDTKLITFNEYIPFFSVQKMRTLCLAYMGSIYYWRDYFAQYVDLETYANSLVGKTISAKDGYGIVLGWQRGKRAEWGVWLNLYNEYSKRVVPVFYEFSLPVRNNMRNIQRAKQEDTIKIDALGMLMYPSDYWAENMLGVRIGSYPEIGHYYSEILESERTYEYRVGVVARGYEVITDNKGNKTYLFNSHDPDSRVHFTRKPPHNTYFPE